MPVPLLIVSRYLKVQALRQAFLRADATVLSDVAGGQYLCMCNNCADAI